VPGGASPKYAQGYLLFLREQTLMVQRFDAGRLELTGDPVAIADQIATGGASGRMGAVSVSDTGALAYHTSAGGEVSRLVWVDRTGREVGSFGEPGNYGDVELSPDGRRAMVSFAATTANSDLWLLDLARGLRTRFTFRSGVRCIPSGLPTEVVSRSPRTAQETRICT
jgi:hypothetical protein